jgi:hypothetical protein
MKTMRSLTLFCGAMLAVGTLAAQYSSNPSSGQQGQPQMQQPQSQPGSQMPGSQTPGSQAPGSQGQQQPGQPGQSPEGRTQTPAGHPTIDDQVNMLTQDLSLTPDQQTKMRGILEDQHKQAMTIVDDPSMSRDDKIQKIRALREATIQKTRTMLDDNQKKKLDDMLNEPPHGAPGGPSGSQPSGTTGSQPSTGTPGSKPPTSPPPDSSKPPQF